MSAANDDLELDRQNRERALDLDSFIVEAPAGAGKTELLTQRFLRLLVTADEPEEIVALTFTNKAAGEMHARIVSSLVRGRDPQPPAEPHKRRTWDLARAALNHADVRGWQLDVQPGRLRVMTLDALCASLARQMPLLSRFGTQPALADDAWAHYAEAARRTLDLLDDADTDTETAEAVATGLRHLDNDVPRMQRLLAGMLARREQWQGVAGLDHPEADVTEALQALLERDLAAVAQILDADVQRMWMPGVRFAASQLGDALLRDWSQPLSPEPGLLPQWQRLTDFLLTKDGEVRRRLDVRIGFPAGPEFRSIKDAFLVCIEQLSEPQIAALRALRELALPDPFDEAVVRAMARILRLAAAQLWLVFRERREVDFVELGMRAMRALGDELAPTDLAQQLDYRVRHLLVDEFQDTSPTQVELIERLTAGWQAGDGRTLFLVGDPMQSIYRFRKADVGLFLRVIEQGIGGVFLERLRLTRNNRSCPDVVAWINRQFPSVFPGVDDRIRGEIAYRPFVATRIPLPGAGVSLHPVAVSNDTAIDDASAQEARAVLAIIGSTWAEDATRDVAVLVRSRDHLSALVAALRRTQPGWRYSAVDIDPLLGRQVIQDLVSLLRALLHRADRVNWLAILRAPWCGLRLADLHALAAQSEATVWQLMNDDARVASLSEDGQLRLGRVRRVMHGALAGRGRQRLRRWVEDTWCLLGGSHCVQDPAELEDAAAFFDRIDALDAAGRFELDRIEDDLRQLYAAPDTGADGRLQLMTIHKAKGLEFDTVIVPGLHRSPGAGESSLLAWDTVLIDGEERLVAAPVNPRGAKNDNPTSYDRLRRLERQRAENEEARVLYVAATRAIRHLHLVGVVSRDAAGEWKSPRGNSLIARLWPAFESAATGAGDAGPDEIALPLAEFVPSLQRLAQFPEQTSPVVTPVVAEDEVDEAPQSLAAAVGVLTHAVLEQVARRPRDWPLSSLPSREPNFVAWLRSRGWTDESARKGARQVAAMLDCSLRSADGQWLLRDRPDAAAELALTKVGAGGTAQTRVMDRSFIDAGVRWIIDYKTAQPDSAFDESVLQGHAERYRAQLEGYASLFSHEPLPVRCGVFYVAYGKLITLD